MSSQAVIIKLVENPRAVTIILGHLGATRDTLERYAQLYTQERQCSVVAAASPPTRFMLNQTLQPTAREILQHATNALKQTTEPVPVVVHSFSNGGAFLLEQMEGLLETDHEEQHDDADCDLKLISSRMKQGYQMFDSCPCYIRTVFDWAHFNESFPNPSWSTVGRYSYAMAASCSLTLWCTLTLSLQRPGRFWNQMIESRACMHQIYIYSTCDMASDSAAVERLIEQRREKYGDLFDCTVYRYEDSDHCRLLKDHPDDYNRAIDLALQAAIERSASATDATTTATPPPTSEN